MQDEISEQEQCVRNTAAFGLILLASLEIGKKAFDEGNKDKVQDCALMTKAHVEIMEQYVREFGLIDILKEELSAIQNAINDIVNRDKTTH